MEDKEKRYPSIKKITREEHIEIVQEIFSTITEKYDFLNHFLSLRRDIAWRKFAVKKMKFKKTNRLLDVACGTCDVALYAAERYPGIKVFCIDFVQEMLEAGRKKISDKGLNRRVDLIRGDGCFLPFCDALFDVAVIAFGIRNIPDKKKALSEMTRVVVPKGQVMVLEMAFTRNWFSNLLYRFYLNCMLPALAKIFSRNYKAYHYLADSIMNFPDPEDFKRMMEESGLEDVKINKLTLGITYLFLGTKK
ncbi:MAG TPA: bifunctional demethylmenaquinone methyltransferase/2-methoxy-6-polyprenyl-1,4-benzoquinol methylase UbiE [Syntrophorhabdaceae bacterium]|nr:bifunctional demethylmenaquinone methyltransferase/2-methoxy-6-polyprenyl-1,4-benzoquinol methylase UbiE [Syntrophorhabdaceae bacterium]HPU29578.1 bifunctional demethylmenaquinone methyltransferase/2-methoxy-6-polyprenyl-1,4-benzoquinol methylase UbiE [Syntrophorhabdaceae bacterium]